MEQKQNAEVVRVDGPPPPKPRLTGNVKVTDSKPSRIHRKEDLGGALLALVLLLAVLSFALMGTDHTTTEEVKAVFGDHLRNLLLIPLRLAEGLFLLASPIAVTVALACYRAAFVRFAAAHCANTLAAVGAYRCHTASAERRSTFPV